MERLTNNAWRNFDPWECCGQDKYCQRGCHDPGGCTKGCIVPQLYARLGAYEDTGLTPGEVKSMQEEHFSGLEMAKLHSALMELKKYQEADKDGRLVVLPCKVGDTVYYWDGCQIIDYKVENFSVFDGNEWLMYGVHREKGNGIISFGREFWAHEFYYCKTVFLTHEEAEKALEAMKDE